MTFTPKTWVNSPSTTTPLDATGLVDLETRLSNYTDQRTSKVFYALENGVKADGKTVTDASISSGNNQLSSVSATFTSADVNKLCVVVGAGTPLSGTLNGASGTSPITALTVNSLAAAIPPGGVKLDDGVGHSQSFVTSGALAGATSIPLAGVCCGGLTSALSTGAPITSLPCAPLDFAIASGTVTLISILTGGVLKTQTFATSGAAIGATSIPVTSQTPNYAYPESTTVFGSAIAVTPNFNYPSGTTFKTDAPALSTTIQSVAGGVATLAANAGTTVSGGECFYGTDDTAALLNCKAAAEAVGGNVILPEGDIAISAAIGSGVPVGFLGQGVKEMYGGATGFNDLNWPTVAPYLKGSVLVQCAPNTDAIQLTAQGRAQNVRNLGIRFAGRFINTGHGLNVASASGFSNIDGVVEDVKVFGHDGNHYGFVFDSPELMRWIGLRSYGGGGMWFKTNAGIPSVPGNVTCSDYYSCTFIAGWAQGVLIDASGAPALIAFDSNLFENLEAAVRIPNPAIAGTTPPPNGGMQNCIRTFNGITMTLTGMVLPGFESDPTGALLSYPNGPTCWRTNDMATGGFTSQAYPTTGPASGTAYQNLVGKPLIVLNEALLQPAATATASTTTTANTGSGATSIAVTSSTGFSTGQGIQIDTGVNMEYAVVASIPDGTHINVTTPGNYGLEVSHTSPATVAAGAAVCYAETSSINSFPSKRWARQGIPIGAGNQHTSFNFPLPTSWWFKLTFANASRMWTDYVGSFG